MPDSPLGQRGVSPTSACPVCGSLCRVSSADEGTSHYEPIWNSAALDGMTRQIADYQMALRVVFELLERGPGTAGGLAERLTENAEDGEQFSEEWVDSALGVLDPYALLDYSLGDGAPVALRTAS